MFDIFPVNSYWSPEYINPNRFIVPSFTSLHCTIHLPSSSQLHFKVNLQQFLQATVFFASISYFYPDFPTTISEKFQSIISTIINFVFHEIYVHSSQAKLDCNYWPSFFHLIIVSSWNIPSPTSSFLQNNFLRFQEVFVFFLLFFFILWLNLRRCIGHRRILRTLSPIIKFKLQLSS